MPSGQGSRRRSPHEDTAAVENNGCREANTAADNEVKVWGHRHRRCRWRKTSSQGPQVASGKKSHQRPSACCAATIKPLPAGSVLATE